MGREKRRQGQEKRKEYGPNRGPEYLSEVESKGDGETLRACGPRGERVARINGHGRGRRACGSL